MESLTKPYARERAYKLNHEVLPYEIERGLPYAVIDGIYSFLRPRYSQTPDRIKMERMKIELNHKITRYKELLLEKKRRLLLRKKAVEHRKELVEKIEGLIKVLEKSL